MGLDASVMCNCYRQGKAVPCPFPEHFIVDADGFPALDLPYEYNEDKFDAFDTWLATCCDHPNMDYAAVFVANSKGYQSFLEALEQVAGEFMNALLDHQLRTEIEHQTGKVRQILVAKAFAEAGLLEDTPPGTVADPVEEKAALVSISG